LRTLSRSSKDVHGEDAKGRKASRRSQSFSGGASRRKSSRQNEVGINSGAKSILLTEDNLASLDEKNARANTGLYSDYTDYSSLQVGPDLIQDLPDDA